jgi:hypothetical protein
LFNEYFISTADILAGHITDLFNKIFDSGHFPQIWSQGFLVPLHKKGPKNITNNYREINLISNFGKLFTRRVEKWFDDNNFLSDAQFCFRRGSSTVDPVFVLNNLIEHVLTHKMRLPCAFIDITKAFDSVYRNALWFKLFNMGFDVKNLKMFQAMYTVVKSCKIKISIATHFQTFLKF